MSNSRLILLFVFGAKPSHHDANVICRLTAEEFRLRKQNMKTLSWSKDFIVDIKKEELDLVFANYNREPWGFEDCK